MGGDEAVRVEPYGWDWSPDHGGPVHHMRTRQVGGPLGTRRRVPSCGCPVPRAARSKFLLFIRPRPVTFCDDSMESLGPEALSASALCARVCMSVLCVHTCASTSRW